MYRCKYWLWLTRVFGIGNERIWEVMRYFDDPAKAYAEILSGFLKDKLSEKELQRALTTSLESCVEIIEICNSKGYDVISYSSPEYPSLLRHIYNPPAILYYDGDIKTFERGRIISIVGARNCCDRSLATEEKLCHDLAVSGNIIASGFAVGADITAHLSAVSADRPTVAVLGCGLDINYPSDNFKYRDKIRKCGVFITEYPIGTSPHPQNFPKRNRILSGIASGVIVIEAGEKSGSLITAELAVQNGREVFCLPPSDIYDSRFAGNIRVLREGATAIYGIEDIRAYYRHFDNSRLDVVNHSLEYVINSDEDEVKAEVIAIEENPLLKKSIDFIKKEKVKSVNDYLTDDLTDEQKKIITCLFEKELHADVIAEKLQIEMSELMSLLTELEIYGIIKALPGKMYKIAEKK